MKFNRMVRSLLENDLYKFNMGQVIYHKFSDYKTGWTFKCRNKDVHFTEEMVEEIKAQVQDYCSLTFSEEELAYLSSFRWLKSSYIDFLRLWRPRYAEIKITTDAECGLSIETSGSWLNTSMYEIPILAIVNETYFRMQYDYNELFESFKKKADDKVAKLESGEYEIGALTNFGLRRRLSAEAEEYITRLMLGTNLGFSKMTGTSNVYVAYLAKKKQLKPIGNETLFWKNANALKVGGTMAHEYIMCVGQGTHKHNPAYSNYYMMRSWVDEYQTQNGVALTDTITTDIFLKDFDLTYATLFSGVRHDSGDPFAWGDKIIAHYEELGIDPMTKTLFFSDSLDFERAQKIRKYFTGRSKVVFGIGTYLTNDTDASPLNIVMKVTVCNGTDVAKISDTEGKGMCKNQEYVDYLQRCIDWRMKYD